MPEAEAEAVEEAGAPAAPEVQEVPPEAVAAAQAVVEQAREKIEAFDGFGQEQIVSMFNEVKGALEDVSKKIEEAGTVKFSDLTSRQQEALGIAEQHKGQGLLDFLDRILGPEPESGGSSAGDEGSGGGGGEDDQEAERVETETDD